MNPQQRHKIKRQRFHSSVPNWVRFVYLTLEWIDYKILSNLSSKLMWFRIGLVDRHCHCPRCIERAKANVTPIS